MALTCQHPPHCGRILTCQGRPCCCLPVLLCRKGLPELPQQVTRHKHAHCGYLRVGKGGGASGWGG